MEPQNHISLPTPASAWKHKEHDNAVDLPLPSGNVARVRRLRPEAFMSNGFIPDPLSHIVAEAINKKSGLPPDKMRDALKDPKVLVSTLQLFDMVLCYVVVDPDVQMPPTCDTVVGDGDEAACAKYANSDIHRDSSEEDYHPYHEGPRNPEILYADTVDMEDKVFVFNWSLGGTHDLRSFRQELAERVESLFGGKDQPNSTQ